ncbi:MAG: PDZ domain-containing protein [Desulfuromonadaceae bacterium]
MKQRLINPIVLLLTLLPARSFAARAAVSEKDPLGLSLSDISPELAGHHGLQGTEGVLVTAINPTRAVAETNLQRFDVILEVNGKNTGNVEGFRAAMGEVKKVICCAC